MARTEVIEKRTARSKTFKNDDGSFTLEAGGGHAHHQKNGQWVETICDIVDDGTNYRPTDHPAEIRIPKSYAQPMRFNDLFIRPLDFSRPPARVDKNSKDVLYVDAYNGIDVRRIVSPEGIVEELTVTSAAGQVILEWELIGGTLEDLVTPTWSLETEGGIPELGQVPASLVGTTLSYDLTQVPIGAVVR